MSASGFCVFSSKSAAKKMFLDHGLTGDTTLCKVKDADNVIHLLWVNKQGADVVFLPVFAHDIALPDMKHAELMPLTRTVFITYQKQELNICFLVVFHNDDIVIRMLKIFPDQTMVEEYCALKGIVPQSISLCKMHKISGNQYVTACWSIWYEDPKNLDEDGEPIRMEEFLPVDLADSDLVDEDSLRGLNSIYLHENDFFKVQGTIYRVAKDEEGKLFITKDFFTQKNEKERSQEPLSKKEKEAENAHCCIVPLRQH